MTSNEFAQACAQRYIDPPTALENDDVVKALEERDDTEVLRLLDEEF